VFAVNVLEDDNISNLMRARECLYCPLRLNILEDENISNLRRARHCLYSPLRLILLRHLNRPYLSIFEGTVFVFKISKMIFGSSGEFELVLLQEPGCSAR
jgi:hypothetical protein